MVQPVSFGMWGEPEEKRCIDVIIGFRNIGIGMMKDVVLDFPDCCICSYQVHGIAHIFIYELTAGVRPMNGIMHHSHSYARHSKTTYKVKTNQEPGTGDDARIDHNQGAQKKRKHDNGFDYHTCITVFTQIIILEIRIHPTSQRR